MSDKKLDLALEAARSKKLLCDPPAAAAIETADRMCFTDGQANAEEILAFAACEEAFTAEMVTLAKAVAERKAQEAA